MKKIILSAIMMGICAVSALAQETKERDFKGFNLTVQGGMLYSMNENSWTYYNDDKSKFPTELKASRDKLGYGLKDLFTPQTSITIGYDFGHALGVRAQANFAKNASAGNHNEHSTGGFYPYSFNSLSLFGDLVFNISGFIAPEKQHLFETKIYIGAGMGDALSADTQYLPDKEEGGATYDIELKNAFGLRAGIIEELYINKHLGAILDVNLEAYTDQFNGFVSVDNEVDESFPYDLRVVGSIGLVYHF